jgi:methyl coenzyme M reductase subunit C
VVEAGKLVARLKHEVDTLVKEGAAASDIAIVSLRGQTRSSVAKLDQVGSHRVVRADATDASEHIVSDTFLRLKGLDRPFVIVTEIDDEHASQYDVRMHIALTRATVRCVVLCTPEAVEKDERLGRVAELLRECEPHSSR